MTASTDRAQKSGVLSAVRLTALLTTIAALAQFLIGGYLFTASNAGLVSVHNILGLVTLVAGIAATVAAFMFTKRGGNRGLAFHILGTTVLILVQYGLGEMISSQALTIVHMVLGIAILISAIAMTTLAFRKPFARV
ncbi:MAG: hypothetical protein Q4F67_04005 [Propionibacteriaceae bacterium]|nr:hypothetical protein [Propionibacteriaceae bacterium]